MHARASGPSRAAIQLYAHYTATRLRSTIYASTFLRAFVHGFRWRWATLGATVVRFAGAHTAVRRIWWRVQVQRARTGTRTVYRLQLCTHRALQYIYGHGMTRPSRVSTYKSCTAHALFRSFFDRLRTAIPAHTASAYSSQYMYCSLYVSYGRGCSRVHIHAGLPEEFLHCMYIQ